MYSLARRILFRLDAEDAHDIVTSQMQRVGDIPLLLSLLGSFCDETSRAFERRVWGLKFRNPIGIAAGFDKNAELVPFLRALGFGFVEVGTVTLRPQSGNPRPRMFRYPKSGALINRLGFNNDGADAVSRRLSSLRKNESAAAGPLLVNIGKNRDVALNDAAAAYAECYRRVAPWADGIVVNVSSPNTPNLRDLQTPEHLSTILEALRHERESVKFETAGEHPIIVKIAPDVTKKQLGEIAGVCVKLADGMTATNTTVTRDGLAERTIEAGGLSGKPLFARSTEVLHDLRLLVGADYPLIGVGGIFDATGVEAKLLAGADLVQAYTGFIYVGPFFVKRILRSLERSDLATKLRKTA